MGQAGFTHEGDRGERGGTLLLEGRWSVEEAGRLRGLLADRRPARLDLSDVHGLDGAAAAVIAAAGRDGAIDVVGPTEPVAAMLALYTLEPGAAPLLSPPRKASMVVQVGEATAALGAGLRGAAEHVGRFTLACAAVVRRPRSMPWASVVQQVERHGVDGVPIVVLITFLVGVVSAFQASLQLAKFGADTLVADLVSLSLTRELAPLMTAIVLAGRSGAAIAAELGTMRVSEEVDALRVMGLDPHRYLVLPRVLALVLVAPILTLMADLVGIAGGMLVALTSLEVSWQGFLQSTREAVEVFDVLGGLLKAVLFGALVAMIACERGLATRGGAEGVGRATTSAVVVSLFSLVTADAVFGVLFSLWGL